MGMGMKEAAQVGTSLSDLAPNPRNPRKITDEKLKMLEAAIEEFGSLDGIVYNETTKRLIGGHQRQKVDRSAKIIITQRYDPPTDKGTTAEGYEGSGSTLIACEKTNRRCFGMEIDPHYCDVIVARWEKFTGKEATLEASDG